MQGNETHLRTKLVNVKTTQQPYNTRRPGMVSSAKNGTLHEVFMLTLT